MEELRDKDFDCPSLLRDEELEDLETKNSRGITRKRRRDGEGEVFNQREDEEAGGETGSENKDEEDKETQAGSKHEVTAMEITKVCSIQRSILYSTTGGDHSVSFSQVPGSETVDSCPPPPAKKKRKRIPHNAGQSRMRDGGQQQLSSQRELAEYHPHPMHSPPPLHRASAPLFTTTYNPSNLIPPLVHTLAHTPPLFLDAVEAGSSLAHRDSQSLQTDTSKGAPSFSGNFATKVPQLTSTAPSFPTLSNQTVPSHSNLQASLSSPGQSRMRDGGQQQLSSQRELAEYHPHPMHSPPPLHRASAPLFTTTYNPANLIPPFVHTLAHTPPLFLDAVEAGSSFAHRDSQSLQTGTSKGAPSFSGNFATKVPQLTSTAPSFPTLSNQTVPSHSNLQASLSSPGQSRMRDGGQQQLSSQGELAEYHPHPMHSPPPLHRASAPLFTTTYNPANLIPPFVHTLAHTPPLFLDAVEAGSSFAHCDSQSLQTDTSKGAPSFSGNFATKVPQLTSTAPSFPTLSNQTVPSHSNLQASLSSPGQSRVRDGGQQQLSSQRELAEYHLHPMHSPPPLHRASAPLFTTTYNPANLIPPFVHTLAHTPPLFLDAVEAGSSFAHCDSQSLQTGTSKGAPSFSGNFATKVPQLTSRAPSFPTLSNQTVPSHSNLQASLSSPDQSRMRDGGQHQLSSQRELAEYHPHPMHSPPPLHRASAPLFTTTYNPANLIPPLVHTLAHTPPLFLDAVEAGSSLAHRDSQSLQTGTRSFFDFGEKLGDLTSSQQNNNLPCQLQPSYPSSQPQHQPQASLPYMAYLPPPPYPTHTPPDSNPTPYLTFGPGGNSTGMVTNLTRGHAYFQSQSRGQVLLQSAGHHGGMAEITPTRASSLLPSQVSPAAPECPPAPPCVKIEREIHSQVHFDFSPHRFFT
ncbi:proline-rich protein 36-like isoform X3 [Acanthopagrus latus]|uniref:proline-rich protein 36-like isoform X3 n=1 Tax=Acanthopagrus latus TaxID=8177 RepID=UPI00187CCD87|nr:proline-rich protein 36-like isoform X3 [Acanthopagrus latus]